MTQSQGSCMGKSPHSFILMRMWVKAEGAVVAVAVVVEAVVVMPAGSPTSTSTSIATCSNDCMNKHSTALDRTLFRR